MGNKINDPIARLMGLRYKSHPWHGLEVGDDAPEIVTAFIEMVPTDTVKYELDKVSGYIRIDRPQKYSNVVPALYGFIPQSYCGDSVAEFCMERSGRKDIKGDGDPLDICVLTERNSTLVKRWLEPSLSFVQAKVLALRSAIAITRSRRSIYGQSNCLTAAFRVFSDGARRVKKAHSATLRSLF